MPATAKRQTTYDDPLMERLVEGRTVSIADVITPELADKAICQLQYLDRDSGGPITLQVFSPGGDVFSGLAVIDAARACRAPVRTLGTGLVASMGALVLACAAPRGSRFLTRSAEVMVHQVLGGVSGQQADIEIEAEHILAMRSRLDLMMAEACGITEREAHELTDRNRWLTAEQAVELGIADEIVGQ